MSVRPDTRLPLSFLDPSRTTARLSAPLLAVAALISWLAASGCTRLVREAGTPETPTLTVSGEGKVSAQPDIAVVNLGLEVRHADPKQAVELNNKQVSLLVANLKAMGLTDADLQTSNFSIRFEQPRTPPPEAYDAPESSSAASEPETEKTRTLEMLSPPKRLVPSQPTGMFVVNNTLMATVRDITRLGDVLSTSVTAGANNVWGVELRLDKPEALQAEARALAIRDALAKAQRMAQVAGVKLGPIVSISEPGTAGPGPAPSLMFARASTSTVPIEAGSLDVGSSVVVQFELER